MNVSSTGVYVEIACSLQLGQQVAFVFDFGHAAPGGTRAACAARVLRVDRRKKGYGVAATYEAIGLAPILFT